jgi:hypothetical protein
MINILKRFKIQAAIIVLCGLTWAYCPWFAQFKTVKASDCGCTTCIDSCEHMDDGVCGCSDNDCGCPACVGSDS